ncbi:hypothetical protein [Halonotius sp. GCM10025705]|uniref:hypothetical protein n=1 Tax=Halonotius sp. GCM10025705 TaxID=3252678 RepID=UPI0036075001
MSDGTSLIYNNQKAVYSQFDDAEVWGFGTFFNENGFHTKALESIRNVDDLIRLLRDKLRGHYVFVINSGEDIQIITDKLGLINVFYSNANGVYISTDPVLVSICSSNVALAEQEAKEFILNEATVGNKTIFTGTERLGFGQGITVKNGDLTTDPIHTYSIEEISFEKHIERISNYFEQISEYQGPIAADISAGFDTRTVAAVGHATINNLAGNTNPNPNDRGADETISPKIASKLSIPLSTIKVGDRYQEDQQIMIHGTTLGRDVARSSRLPKRMEKKYQEFDLILGGYGGETLRAKYNGKSISDYYNADRSKELFSDSSYRKQLLSKISSYPDINTNKQKMNLIYTIDRMRIWGGSWITMSSIYGDVLHPFMDWYLINPVFSRSPKDLKNGVYQEKIIEHFAPQLSGVPINATSKMDQKYRNTKKQLAKCIKKSDILTTTAKKILALADSTADDKRVSQSDNIDFNDIERSVFTTLNINKDTLQSSADLNTVSRLRSVSAFINYMKRESSQLDD